MGRFIGTKSPRLSSRWSIHATEASGILRVGVDRESCADFFSQIAATVVLGRKLKIDASRFTFTGFVLNAEVGQRNLSANEL